MTRIIHYSSEDGSIEGVFFTEDLAMKTNDIIPPDCKLYSDTIIEVKMPYSFPMETNLEKTT